MLNRLQNFNGTVWRNLLLVITLVTTIWVSMNRHSTWNYWYVLHWDSEGYYMYLPAVFLNGGFENMYTKTEDEGKKVFKNYPGTNKLYTKYTCGVAVLLSPFFLVADAYTSIFGIDKGMGYAPPFLKLLIIGVAFYLCIGMLFVYKTIKMYSSEFVTIVSCLIVWLGTNLLCYSALMPGFAHPFSFAFVALFVYLTHQYYSHYKIATLFYIVLTVGIIVLLRPTDILVTPFFFLFKVNTWNELKDRLLFWIKKPLQLLLFPLAILIAYVPQFLYWKNLSGHFLLYSYEKEGFTLWQHPMLPEIWYHPQNGLFLYAPLLLLSIVGIFWAWNKKEFSSKVILLIFLTQSYLCASWWYWNFGAAYGYRPFINFLPILVLPIAFVLNQIMGLPNKFRYTFMGFIFFLLFLSVRMNMTYTYPWQGPDWGWDDVLQKYLHALFLK